MATLEEAKAFLKKAAPDGTNLYDHLSDVLLKILVERPENLHDSFEYLSTIVKQQRYVTPPQPTEADSSDSQYIKDMQSQQEKWCNAALDLLKIKSQEEGAAPPATGVADLLDEANMLEWAGLGFSKGEIFRLSVALQRLAQTNSTVSMRFWGKILGYGVDFYIAEGQLASQDEPADANAEEGVNGVNRFTYWAMKDDGNYTWNQLPNVQREQILATRELRRFVRGDLDGKVGGQPPFPGTEKHFLRAQIARISAGTVVCPAGYFQETEEGEIEPVEEPAIKDAQELAELGNWVHFSKEINAKYGRTIPLPPQTNNDGEEIPWEGEEFAESLRSLSEDAPNSWRIDRLPATLIPPVGEIAVIRSLVWPGAVGIAVGKKFLNVYVGHATKFSHEPHQLPPPKPIQAGFGIGVSEDGDGTEGGNPVLRFKMMEEQKDILSDPSPPEEEDDS